MSFQTVSSKIKPSPHTIVRRLRKHHPAVYREIVSGFKPLEHSFDLIPALYAATDDRVLFFGSMLLLYGKYDPLTMPSRCLHDGLGVRISEATGLLTSNISNFLTQAAVYFRVPGYPEQVKQFIYDTVGISL